MSRVKKQRKKSVIEVKFKKLFLRSNKPFCVIKTMTETRIIPPLEAFQGRENEDWKLYEEKLSFYYSSSDITDNRTKRDILINQLSMNVFKILREMLLPAKLADTQYEDIVEHLRAYYSPVLIVFKERKLYFNAKKGQHDSKETITEFVKRLKGLAEKCKFKGNLSEYLLNQFVMGVDEATFLRLTDENEDLQWEKAVKIALKVEMKASKKLSVHWAKSDYNDNRTNNQNIENQGGIGSGHSNRNENTTMSNSDKSSGFKNTGNVKVVSAINNKFPNKVPIIVDRHTKDTHLPVLEKKKFLVPQEMTLSQFLSIIRNRMPIDHTQALFLLVNNRSMISLSRTLGHTYYEYHNIEDGYLHLTYTSEKIFG